jgi:hypothetical protein
MHRDSLDRYTNAQSLDMCVKLQHIRAPGWYGDRIRPMSPTPLDWCAQTRLDSKIPSAQFEFLSSLGGILFQSVSATTSVMHVSDHYIARGVPIDRQYSGGETGINIGKWNSISISDVVGIPRNDQTITACHPRLPQPNYNDECGSNSFFIFSGLLPLYRLGWKKESSRFESCRDLRYSAINKSASLFRSASSYFIFGRCCSLYRITSSLYLTYIIALEKVINIYGANQTQ